MNMQQQKDEGWKEKIHELLTDLHLRECVIKPKTEEEIEGTANCLSEKLDIVFKIQDIFESELKANTERVVENISMLRQWLNEDRITDTKKMVTNEELEVWLKKDKGGEEQMFNPEFESRKPRHTEGESSEKEIREEWESGLQFEVMEDYIMDSQRMYESDEKREKMREHFEKLKSFIRDNFIPRSTLQSVLEGMEIGERPKDWLGDNDPQWWDENAAGYNQALADIKVKFGLNKGEK